ncbi:hypothetical protein [Agromyces mangrovi Wang et al. 2018]|uniref:hypothetical protein n=1 Tax=Agromyces mangrovi TaxID=1858653 RepID=UPI0025723A79|nr:hypothetical protein [Agromyces mangrovi]BDZ65506.1 hypothetical protein GCM10025877_24440 [Agromyces mangrovi]
MTEEWIEHRRGDGELVGWMLPEDDGFVVIDLLGRRVTDVVDWGTAEETLDEAGLRYLAEPYLLDRGDDEPLRVRIVEASRDRILVTEDFGGAIGGPVSRIELPFPAPETLRLRLG